MQRARAVQGHIGPARGLQVQRGALRRPHGVLGGRLAGEEQGPAAGAATLQALPREPSTDGKVLSSITSES